MVQIALVAICSAAALVGIIVALVGALKEPPGLVMIVTGTLFVGVAGVALAIGAKLLG